MNGDGNGRLRFGPRELIALIGVGLTGIGLVITLIILIVAIANTNAMQRATLAEMRSDVAKLARTVDGFQVEVRSCLHAHDAAIIRLGGDPTGNPLITEQKQ